MVATDGAWRLALVLAAGLAGCATGAPRAPDPALGETARDLFAEGLRAQRAGDGVRAEQYLAAAFEQGHPAHEVMPALLAVCIAADRYETALSYARARLLAAPEDWPLRYLVAALEVALGQAERARTELDELVAVDPTRAEPHFLLAVLARDHDRDAQAARRAFAAYLARAPAGRHAAEARRFLRRPAAAASPTTARKTAGP